MPPLDLKLLNADAWLPTVLKRDGYRWDDHNELALGIYLIHWSGWIQNILHDTFSSWWVAYPKNPKAGDRVVMAPCFTEPYEYKEGDLVRFDDHLSYGIAHHNDAKFYTMATDEKLSSFARLINFLGYSLTTETMKVAESLVRPPDNICTDPDAIAKLASMSLIGRDPDREVRGFWGTDACLDGEIICPKCSCKLNRTDLNCWRCGHDL